MATKYNCASGSLVVGVFGSDTERQSADGNSRKSCTLNKGRGAQKRVFVLFLVIWLVELLLIGRRRRV